jgi:hypothetical protein
LALLAEHSFWFSGRDMVGQLPAAIQSFNSQKHTNFTMMLAEVDTAFNNASDRNYPAWLIQWVIDNKLVCNIILHLLFKILTFSLEAQLVFLLQSIRIQTMSSYLYIYISVSINDSSLDLSI